MVTIKREVLVDYASAQQPNSELSSAPPTGSVLPHPALAVHPRQEDYEFVIPAFRLDQEQGYATASEEWRQQYHLHQQLAGRERGNREIEMEKRGRNPQLMSDYYQQQLKNFEAANKRRLQEREKNVRDEGSYVPSLADETGKPAAEGLRIPIRPEPAEILSGPTVKQLEALVQKAGYDQWHIQTPVPRFEPDFSRMDREAINKYHQEMVAQEVTMRQQLLRSPANLTLREHREARRAFAIEFQRLERMNNLRMPAHYSLQAHIQRSQDLAAIEANLDFQRWKQQTQNSIDSTPQSQGGKLQPRLHPSVYQIQLMLLEQQNVKRLEIARQEQDQVNVEIAVASSTVTCLTQNQASVPLQVDQERDLEAEFHSFFPRRSTLGAPARDPPSKSRTTPLMDYEMQITMLEQQNRKRIEKRKRKQERMDATIKTEEPSESSQGGRVSPASRQPRRRESHNRKRVLTPNEEQEYKDGAKVSETPEPDIDTSWPSEPTAGSHVLRGYQRAFAQLEQQHQKRIKTEQGISDNFPNRALSLLPDVNAKTEVIYKVQVQQNGWADVETDRDTSMSALSTPEATPEAEQINTTGSNLHSPETARSLQDAGAASAMPNSNQFASPDGTRPLVIRGKLPATTRQ